MAGITSGTFLGIRLSSDKSIETRKMVLNKGEHYLDETGSKLQKTLSKFGDRIKKLFQKSHRIHHYSKYIDKDE